MAGIAPHLARSGARSGSFRRVFRLRVIIVSRRGRIPVPIRTSIVPRWVPLSSTGRRHSLRHVTVSRRILAIWMDVRLAAAGRVPMRTRSLIIRGTAVTLMTATVVAVVTVVCVLAIWVVVITTVVVVTADVLVSATFHMTTARAKELAHLPTIHTMRTICLSLFLLQCYKQSTQFTQSIYFRGRILLSLLF